MKSTRRSARRPLIGISMRLDPSQKHFYLQSNYSQAVCAAGGAAVMVPLIPDKGAIAQLVDRLDGIVLSGSGSDIDPSWYGARKIAACGDVHTDRDKTDFLLLEEAFRRQMPVLAICFGVQSLNVFLGGTLIQDIPSQRPKALEHALSRRAPSKANPENFCTHRIEVLPGTLLSTLVGTHSVVRVNSSHHQAIDRAAAELQVTALAPDGIIEGVELKSKNHFVMGTQWHPEKGFEKDSLSQRIFNRFIQKAGRR
ncbi:MAG: gamma-glutamyl-gamma-aminobutyrate hydrolase family protein [Acidobacteriia bacterium]|nr:gamma-glutamyl-gamma-aminobutyrate hydrolase family protein [Terriglobia bacterium]